MTVLHQDIGDSSCLRTTVSRWVREKRLSAYEDYFAAIDMWMECSTMRWLEDRLANPASDDFDIGSQTHRHDSQACGWNVGSRGITRE